MSKKIVFSGIQPSGIIHIGNYLGALKQWVDLQNQPPGEEARECIFCVVDLHAITAPQDPAALRKNTTRAAALYVAAGIDPERSIIFIQSHVPAHAELGWILNTITPLGELERMTQFKDKSIRRGSGQAFVLAGLLNYPTLMAADILLYNTDAVPVGEDQTQHVELTREIARKFNVQFGETFKMPELMLTKAASRIMGLDDPTKKMSKSASSEMNYISLLDDADAIRKKIKAATTDSGSDIRYDETGKPGISNLLAIASACGGKPIESLEKEFDGASYVAFKDAVAEIIIAHLAPLRHKYNELADNENELMKILRLGAERAGVIAERTLKTVYERIGFVTR